jgi:hypothetical protein
MDLEEELELEEGRPTVELEAGPGEAASSEREGSGQGAQLESAALSNLAEAADEDEAADEFEAADEDKAEDGEVPKRRRLTAPSPLAPLAPPAAPASWHSSPLRGTAAATATLVAAAPAAASGATAKAARERAKEQNLSLFAAFADGAAFTIPKLKPRMSLVVARKQGLLPGTKK